MTKSKHKLKKKNGIHPKLEEVLKKRLKKRRGLKI